MLIMIFYILVLEILDEMYILVLEILDEMFGARPQSTSTLNHQPCSAGCEGSCDSVSLLASNEPIT